MFDLFLSAPRCHDTYLVMLNTYNYVVGPTRMEHYLHFFLHSPQDHSVMVRVRVWSSRQTYGRYYTETCGRYCTEEGRVTMVTGQNGTGQNGTDKMVRTKWYTD